MGSSSEMPSLALLPGWLQLALSWCGGWDFLRGSTRLGHNRGYQSLGVSTPVGALHGAVSFPGLSYVNLCFRGLLLCSLTR